jgi:alpha-N-arabinofuranosidase
MSDAISRRGFLVGAAAGAVAGATIPAAHALGRARQGGTATLRIDEGIGTIKPNVHGHFAEHLGGVIYDGIWVGPDSKVENVDGVRKALIDAMKPLGSTIIRWPGGCFADRYHWRDGIGPREKRRRTFGRWREDTEPNHFGTHEFLRFCELVDCDPYLAVNIGTGSSEEFQQWVEYTNAPLGTVSTADERAANGRDEPWKVRYWGVGNESWGCGGKFIPEEYCNEYRKFTEWVPGYGVPLYFVASGPNGNDVDWTRRFFERWADGAKAPIQGWSPHYYCGTTGHAVNFSVDQWYEMLWKADRMEKLVLDQWGVIGEFDRDHRIKLCVDEWGTWHPPGTEINKRHQLEQMGTLRDALVAALTLDTFHRHAEKVDMANIAQLVNCLQSLFLADGDRFVTTPNYHAFAMYRPHQGARALRLEVDAPSVEFKTKEGTERVFRVAGSASRREGTVTLTLVHTHATEPYDLAVALQGGAAKEVTHTSLADAELNAHNTFETPERVVPKAVACEARGGTLNLTLPPASVNRFDITLA